MTRLTAGAVVLILVVAIAGAATLSRTVAAQGASSQGHPLVTQAEFDRWQTELSNWGRWGPNDEMGTLNLVTPAKRKQAAALVKEGFPVSLSAMTVTEKNEDVANPVEWAMLNVSPSGSSDRIAYPGIHGAAHTHIDTFAHQLYKGTMYNGYPASEHVTLQGGATRDSVLTMKDGIVTRGVLYDIPRLKGVAYLEPGTRIYPEDMEAWEKKSGAKVGPGDALIIRWGRWSREATLGPYRTGGQAAGFDNSILPWLKKRDVALIAWETPDYTPKPEGDLPGNTVHNFVLYRLGMHVIDRGNYEALAEAAATRKRWEFMLTVAPLLLPKATGSPVNPIAMF